MGRMRGRIGRLFPFLHFSVVFTFRRRQRLTVRGLGVIFGVSATASLGFVANGSLRCGTGVFFVVADTGSRSSAAPALAVKRKQAEVALVRAGRARRAALPVRREEADPGVAQGLPRPLEHRGRPARIAVVVNPHSLCNLPESSVSRARCGELVDNNVNWRSLVAYPRHHTDRRRGLPLRVRVLPQMVEGWLRRRGEVDRRRRIGRAERTGSGLAAAGRRRRSNLKTGGRRRQKSEICRRERGPAREGMGVK
jgi:hypothetical protein